MPAAPIVFGREFFEVDPRSTALIVIDMQNAFVAPDRGRVSRREAQV
jgi:isochorismate hydrolase